MKNRWLTIVIVFLAFPVVSSGELLQATKNDNVREKPFIDGRIVLAIKSGQSVDIQKREGSWYFVTVGKKSGWLPMLSVRRTKPATVATKGSVVQTGRSSTGSIISTTGVRGLNEENLKAAVFSEDAVVAIENTRVLPADATTFAAAGGVFAQNVPPLEVSSRVPDGGKK